MHVIFFGLMVDDQAIYSTANRQVMGSTAPKIESGVDSCPRSNWLPHTLSHRKISFFYFYHFLMKTLHAYLHSNKTFIIPSIAKVFFFCMYLLQCMMAQYIHVLFQNAQALMLYLFIQSFI